MTTSLCFALAASACGFPRPADVIPDGGVGDPDSPTASLHVVLDWQIASVLPSGDPDPKITFTPIDPAPLVRIARLDTPFGVDMTTYSSLDGSIAIPSDYIGTTWRLEYTLAGDVTHEIQWAPEAASGHVTVPLFGRLQRAPLPPGSGYSITPSNHSGSYAFPRVLTTGLWSEGVTAPPVGSTLDYDFANAISLGGIMGRPDPTLGDRALLVDYAVDQTNLCTISVGWAPLSSAVQPMTHIAQMPAWDATLTAVASSPVDSSFRDRLRAGLGKLDFSFDNESLAFGIIASIDMPALTVPMKAHPWDFPLPSPVMHPLLRCPNTISSLPAITQPSALAAFPHALHVQLNDFRSVLGTTLMSGMATVVVQTAGAFQISFPAPIPRQFRLATPNGTVALDGDSEQVPVGPATGIFELTFTTETAADLRSDYYDVILHQIKGNGSLSTERIYTVTAPKVRIEASLLVPGADYVFEVRSYKGHPQAPRGNFAPVDFPYGSAIVFPRTFRTS